MLDDVEQVIYDGYRYLGLDSSQVLSKTPREFLIMMDAYVERTYDELDRLATQAMMMRQAYHAKKLKHTDLFKRPSSDVSTQVTAEDIRKKQEDTLKWLAQFKEFKDKVR